MLIPKKNRVAVYSYLFKEGVMVAPKNFSLPKHPDVDVPNLYVCKLMQSLKSRGYVTENFNWEWYYWYLTNNGIEYLRGFLHLPEEIIPATLKKPRPTARAPRPGQDRGGYGGDRGGYGGERPAGRGFGGDRGAYSDDKKLGAAPESFKPDYRTGGFGRGGGGRGRGDFSAYRRDAPAGGQVREGGAGPGGPREGGAGFGRGGPRQGGPPPARQ